MGEGFTTSDTEQHLLHPLHFVVFDCTGNKLQCTVHEGLGSGVLSVACSLRRLCTTQVVSHGADEVDDLVVIFELGDVALNFIDGLALGHHEALAVTHIRLNGIEEQVVALLFLVLD